MQKGETKKILNYIYQTQCLIGEGAFGKVYKGENTTNGEIVAIKKMDYTAFEKDTYLRQALNNEIKILKQFNHPNIVRFIDLVSTERSVYLITEFCEDGDLREYLRRNVLNEQEVISLMIQIVRAFKELLKYNVIHRDLKPANILTHRGVVKIADFGLAKYVDNEGSSMLRSCVGSPIYMAPQVLMKKPYTTKCDIWSLGVLYYEMLYKDFPFSGRSESELLQNIQTKDLKFKPNLKIQQFTEDFLRKALIVDETKRLAWNELFDMFEEQERILYNNKQIKEHYKFSQIREKEQVISPPAWIRVDQQNKYQITDAGTQLIKNLVSIRIDLQFRHFVVVELFSHLNFCKRFLKRELMFERLITLLSKNVYLQYRYILQQIENTLQQIEFMSIKEQLQLLQGQIKKEFEYSQILLQDILELMDVLGIMQNMFSSEEFSRIYQINECDPWEVYIETNIRRQAAIFTKDVLQDLKKHQRKEEANLLIEFLTLIDYILDIFITRQKTKAGQEPDYDQIHSENVNVNEPQKYCDILLYKLRQVESQ